MVAIYVFLLMMVAKIAHSRKKRVAADEGEVGWVIFHKILYICHLDVLGPWCWWELQGVVVWGLGLLVYGFFLIGPASATPHMTLEFVPTSTWSCLTQEMHHWDLQLLDPAFFSGVTRRNVTRWFHKHLNHNATRLPQRKTITWHQVKAHFGGSFGAFTLFLTTFSTVYSGSLSA